MDYRLLLYLCLIYFYFLFMYRARKYYKKSKQLEADYNELLKQVVALTNENAELKKERVQI